MHAEGSTLSEMGTWIMNCGPQAFAWLRVVDPAPNEFADIARSLDLPQLAVEDAVTAHQRPKLELYGEVSFLVLKPAEFDHEGEAIRLGEVHVFTGSRFCVTVRHGSLGPLAAVGDRLDGDRDLLRRGPRAVTYAVADAIVDDFEPVVDALEISIEDLEQAVFDVSRQPPTERIYNLVAEVLDFRRATASLLDPLDRLAQGAAGDHDIELNRLFRDVADHAQHAHERTDSFFDLLNGALQANTALIGLQENRDQRKISAWAAVALVPTIIGGIWGMNVGVPLEDSPLGFAILLTLMAAAAGLVYWRLRRNGWL